MDLNIVVYALLVFDAITSLLSLYAFIRLVFIPFWKFRGQKKHGYYIDIHKFDDRGEYHGSITNLSVDEIFNYIGDKLLGLKQMNLNKKGVKNNGKNKH